LPARKIVFPIKMIRLRGAKSSKFVLVYRHAYNGDVARQTPAAGDSR
jgi:hypothetical protein